MAEPVRRRLAIPGQDTADDRLLGIMAALASEVAVLRERLDTVERLAGLESAAIDGFVPDPDAQASRDALRRRLIDKIFGPLRDALARSAEGMP